MNDKWIEATESMPPACHGEPSNRPFVLIVRAWVTIRDKAECDDNVCHSACIMFLDTRQYLDYGRDYQVTHIERVRNNMLKVEYDCDGPKREDFPHNIHRKGIRKCIKVFKNKYLKWSTDDIVRWCPLPELNSGDYE